MPYVKGMAECVRLLDQVHHRDRRLVLKAGKRGHAERERLFTCSEVSPGAWARPAHDQGGRVPLCGSAAADRRGHTGPAECVCHEMDLQADPGGGDHFRALNAPELLPLVDADARLLLAFRNGYAEGSAA